MTINAMRAKEMLRKMRDVIQTLRTENEQLQLENNQLKAILNARQSGSLSETTAIGQGDQDDFGDLDEWSDFLQGSTRMTQTGMPRSAVLKRNVKAQLNTDTTPAYGADYLSADALESIYMGKGVQPAAAQARGVVPSQAMPKPNVDLGYINDVPAEQLDTLPYGLIVLDRDGLVLFYNETESKLAGFAREKVIGKNFFEDVAPCTRVKQFQGRFEQFVKGQLGRVTFFDFAFHFEHGTQNVVIGLSHGRKRGHFNIMLMRT